MTSTLISPEVAIQSSPDTDHCEIHLYSLAHARCWYQRRPQLFPMSEPWEHLFEAWKLAEHGHLVLQLLPASHWDDGDFVGHFLGDPTPPHAFAPTRFDVPATIESALLPALTRWMWDETISDTPTLRGPQLNQGRWSWTNPHLV